VVCAVRGQGVTGRGAGLGHVAQPAGALGC
jgi:hypothetical protein